MSQTEAPEVLVDVRQILPRDRHPIIFNTFDRLPVGGALKLVNDHEPKPLYYQFEAERPGEFSWTPVETGPERWAILIKRVAKAEGTPKPVTGCGCGGHHH